MTPFRILRNVTIAGATGFLCGKGYSIAKANPETVLPIVKLSAASGVAGVLLGWGISAYRNLPTHIYALSLGSNFAITSGVFFSVRHGIMTSLDSVPVSHSSTLQQAGLRTITTEHVQYISSAAGGGLAGTLASIVSRYGLKSVFLTGFSGLACGVCGQLLYNRMEVWRRRKALEIHFPELIEQKEKRWTTELIQERFLNFWHQKAKSGEWDVEVTMLEDAIKEEKEKIAQLDEALSKCGVEVKGDATDSTNPNQQLISQNDLQNLNRTGDSTRTQPN